MPIPPTPTSGGFHAWWLKWKDTLFEKFLLALVLGGVAVLATFLIDRTLQDRQAQQAFDNEIAKLQVERVGEVWSAFDVFRAKIGRAIDSWERLADASGHVGSGASSRLIFRPVRDLVDENSERPTTIRLDLAFRRVVTRRLGLGREFDRLERNRFWLGEDLYGRGIDQLEQITYMFGALQSAFVGMTASCIAVEAGPLCTVRGEVRDDGINQFSEELARFEAGRITFADVHG